ncbi:type II toxin-antitoxin system VapC family toxin [Sorangium sp. So ce1153]|uniref:type II toxin-antitoxin system VapC family toxin n=1 Tax=Sorangium sp. So ce1153 TaxID=3133333 RepID=UPI003F6367A7
MQSAPDAVILDTHVWVHAMDGVKLSAEATRRIGRAAEAGELWIAAITVWEIAMLASKGRIRLSMPTREWVDTAIARSGVRVAPLDPSVAVDSVELPGEFHGDPADRMIVATARCRGATLVTRDRAIIDYGKTKNVRWLKA